MGFILFYFTFDTMSDVAHQGRTQWFDFTKSLDPKCLTVGKVSSEMKKTVGSPLLLSCCLYPTLKNNGQTGRIETSFTCSKLDTQKRLLYGTDISYCAARLACKEMLHNVAGQFVLEERRRRISRHITWKTVSLLWVTIWFDELKCDAVHLNYLSSIN